MGTDLTTGKLTPTNMKTAILICSLLSAASAGPILVNVNGVYLPHQYSSAPYPTAYGYAAGPAHAVHVPQAVTLAAAHVAPVAAVRVHAVPAAAVPAVVKSAPVAAVAVAAAPVAAVQAAPVAAVHASPAVQTVPSSQYHAQDEAGNYKYGYKNINSAKEAAGNVHDHYEAGYYTDHARTVQYVADVNGFREV